MWETLQDVMIYLREPNTVSVIVRVLLAAFAGGVVGFERGLHGRAAGLRTHMLVCLGAALTALIGTVLSAKMLAMGLSTDIQRTGAQVMSGIGFLGAGTILVKKGNSRISGLTTAAGLWATAAIGLAIGYGLYEMALATVFVVVISFTLMSKLEFFINRKRQRVFVYLELDSVGAIQNMAEKIKKEFSGVELQVTPARSGVASHVGLEALIRIPPKVSAEEKIRSMNKLEHVVFALQIV